MAPIRTESLSQKLFFVKVFCNLQGGNLVMGGILSLTTNDCEVWGSRGCGNPLASFFKDFFLHEGLVDVNPTLLKRTWLNCISRKVGIAKHLDWFMMSEPLISQIPHFRTSVIVMELSDHKLRALSQE